METIVITTLISSVIGSIVTPIAAAWLLPTCYAGSGANVLPWAKIPLFLLALPGFLGALIFHAFGMEMGWAYFICGGLAGYGVIGVLIGTVVAFRRRRSFQRR